MTINRQLIKNLSEVNPVFRIFHPESVDSVVRDVVARGPHVFIQGHSVPTIIEKQFGVGAKVDASTAEYLWEFLLKDLDSSLIHRGIAPSADVYKKFLNQYMHQSAMEGFLVRLLDANVMNQSKGQIALFNYKRSLSLECKGGSLYVQETAEPYGLLNNNGRDATTQEEKPFVQAKLIYKISFLQSEIGDWEPAIAIKHLSVHCSDPQLSRYVELRTLLQKMIDILKDFFRIDQEVKNKHLFLHEPPAQSDLSSISPSSNGVQFSRKLG